MTMSNQRYPLDWPQGYARDSYPMSKPLFKSVTLTVAVALVENEVKRLTKYGYKPPSDVVISSNVPLKSDGYPRADYARSVIKDTGVAVYFNYNKEPVVLCCDKWAKVEDNLKAIAVTIEDMRRIERNGVSDFIKRSFTGFKALPAGPTPRPWYKVLLWDSQPNPTPGNLSTTARDYRCLVKKAHPDNGGTNEQFHELQEAWEQAQKYFSNVI